MINQKMIDVIESILRDWDTAQANKRHYDAKNLQSELRGIDKLLQAMGIRFIVYYNTTCPATYKIDTYKNLMD